MIEQHPRPAHTPERDPLSNPENLREIERDIASLVIVSSDGYILMGLKDPKQGGVYPDFWHIPGGGLKPDESLEEAARREGLEETGIDLSKTTLTPLPFTGHGATVKTLKNGERVWCKMTFNRFEARLDRPAREIELHPSDDLVELRWFGPDELSDVPQVPGGKEFFTQAGYIKTDDPHS